MAARRKRKKQSKAAERARQKSSRPSARLTEAESTFQQGNFEEAEALASNVLSRTDADALVQKARTILVESCFRRAAGATNMHDRLDHLDRALDQAPDEARLHYHRGVTLWRLGEVDQAQQAFDLIADDDPRRGGMALLLQLAQAAQGNPASDAQLTPAEANTLHLVEKFTSDAPAEQIKPLLEQPLVGEVGANLWSALLTMRDKPKSVPTEAFASLNGTEATSPVIAYYRGIVALRAGDYEPALEAWRGIAETGFKRPWLQENRYSLLRERSVNLADEGRWQDIVNLSSSQIDAADDRILNETVAAAHFHLGYAAAQKGDWQKARAHWTAANELGSSRYLAQNLALSQEALEEWEDAALAWREMVRRRPRKKTHPDYLTDAQVSAAWAHAAECYAKAEIEEEYDYYPLYEEKLTCLKNAVKYAPDGSADNLRLRTRLVDAYLEEDRVDAAENELKRMLEIDKDYVPALVRLGTVYNDQWNGDPTSLWERALDLEPGNAYARDALAQRVIEVVSGERPFIRQNRLVYLPPRESIKMLEEAVARVPDHPRLLAELGIHYGATGKSQKAIDALRKSWEAAPTNPQSVAYAMHELLHVAGGDKVVAEKLPSVRQITVLRPTFWIAQGDSVLNCELDEQWALNFWDEAVALAEEKKGPDTPVFTLVSIIESAAAEKADHLAQKYKDRLRTDAPNSGALEFVEAFEVYGERQDTGKATRLLRTAQRKARKAGEMQLAEKAEQVSDMINGRMNPLLNLFGGLGGGGPRGGPGGFPGGLPGGLEELLDDMDIDPEEFMDDFFKNL